MSTERVNRFPLALYLRPLGPQGPLIGIKITEIGDIIALDTAMGELMLEERKTVNGILRATERAGLEIVDSSQLPDQQKLDSID
ncbi:hypothetical protein MUP46_00720 [Patescibacteria group bacterium]|nr:hypothetical protein [Patescibacteria group bacterium]